MSRLAPDWHLHAACQTADANLFFGPDDERPRVRQVRVERAKAVCASCPVRPDCFAYAKGHGTGWGVWGGQDLELGGRRCRNGLHVMSVENTYVNPAGGKECRACRNVADQRHRARQQEERAA